MDVCTWTLNNYDEEDTWETSCERSFILLEGIPSENYMKYCCYCGKPIKEVIIEEY